MRRGHGSPACTNSTPPWLAWMHQAAAAKHLPCHTKPICTRRALAPSWPAPHTHPRSCPPAAHGATASTMCVATSLFMMGESTYYTGRVYE